MDNFNVILLAGDRGADDPMAGALGVPRKALLPIRGQAMITYVLEALAQVETLSKVIIVANQCNDLKGQINLEEGVPNKEIAFIEGKTSPATSLKAALEENNSYPTLVVTADCPLLTPEMIKEFLEGLEKSNSDILISFASETNIEAKYPKGKRTYLKFKGDGYSGCNIFGFKSDKGLKVLDFWAKIEKDRKKSFAVIRSFGFWTLILILFRRITIKEAFERVSAKLDLTVTPVLLSDPDAAIDVDRPKHVAIVEEILEKRLKFKNT